MFFKVKQVLRSSWLIYCIYSTVGSAFLKIVSVFIRIDPMLILINSYGGRTCSDSPKEIYKCIMSDTRFKSFKLVWAFIDNDKFPEIPYKVKVGSLSYFYYAMKAKCWITNGGIDMGLRFKRKNQFCLNTWHGTPIKKLGLDIEKSKRDAVVLLSSKKSFPADMVCAQGTYDSTILARALNISLNKLIVSGLPRNDILSDKSTVIISNLREKLCLPGDKKIILYCPTYRDYDRNGVLRFVAAPPISLRKWKNVIGNDYIVLFRAHYFIIDYFNIEFDDFVYDFSRYENLSDLMIVSDMLISDYSSIYFDYSIMGKPMLCYAYDYEKYSNNRGLYIDITKELPCDVAFDENSLLEQITTMDYAQMSERTLAFRDKYIQAFGNATKICVDKIWENIS